MYSIAPTPCLFSSYSLNCPKTRTVKVDSQIPKNLFPLITPNNLHTYYFMKGRHLRNQTSQFFRELSALNENPVYTWSESGGIAVIAANSAALHAHKAKGPILLCIDSFASSVCLAKQMNI